MPTLEESLKALQANPADEAAKKNIRNLVDKDGNGVADSTEVAELAAVTKKLTAQMPPEIKKDLKDILVFRNEMEKQHQSMTPEDRKVLAAHLGEEKLKVVDALFASEQLHKDPVTGLMFTPDAQKAVLKASLDGINSPDVSQVSKPDPTPKIKQDPAYTAPKRDPNAR